MKYITRAEYQTAHGIVILTLNTDGKFCIATNKPAYRDKPLNQKGHPNPRILRVFTERVKR